MLDKMEQECVEELLLPLVLLQLVLLQLVLPQLESLREVLLLLRSSWLLL
jgi:hypothetical protein